MGKISRHNKTKFITAAALCVLLLFFSGAYAAAPQREFELFDQGYKDYLSYHPEKAAEEFRMFLKEFPRSSASDAVMFWFGKSLEQLKSFEEAKKIFADMKRQFPDSPFVKYADKELETMTGVSGFERNVPDKVSQAKIADSVAVEAARAADQAKIQKKEVQKTPEEKEESKSMPLRREILKKAETPAEPAVAAVSGGTSPAASVLEPKKEILKKTEPPVEPSVAVESGKSGKPSPLPVSEEKPIYSAQIGVFKQQKKADVLMSQFKREGYSVKVSKGTLNGADVFRVLVGEFTDKNKAGAIAGKIKNIYGLNTMVISGSGEEVQIAQGERLEKAVGEEGLRSFPMEGKKKTDVPATETRMTRVEEEGLKAVPSPALSKKGVVYSIQIGVFTKQKTTDGLMSEIEKEGYPVKVIKGTSKGRDVFKVLVGQFADKNEAKSVGRILAKKYGENTIVSMSESREEMPAARVESAKAAEDTKKPGSSSAQGGKEMVKVAASGTQTGSKDSELKALPAKTQEQLNKEEVNKHVEVSKDDKKNVNMNVESLKDQKKIEAVPAEKKKDDMTAMATQTVNKDSELKIPAPKSPEQTKTEDRAGKNPEVLIAGNERSSVPLQSTRAEKSKTDDEKKSVKRDAGRSDLPPMEIEGIKYTARDIPKYTAASRSLCDKLQIKGVMWRTGNENEDFLNEQVLYDEAKNLHITPDKKKLVEMVENYQLDDSEADYLQRYLTISSLIERKIRDMPEEKVIESIVVRYDESDRYMKIVLGSDLQNLARKGTPFEEIYRQYPDIVRFSVTGFPELERHIKEKVQSLQDNEIVVSWSQEGYRIFKAVFKGPVFVPFGDISPGLRDRMKTYILAWTKGLREKYSAAPSK